MPINKGFKILAMMTSISSPLPEQEPRPLIPSSVSICTKVVERELLTPERLRTCLSSGIFARRRMVLTSVIFISSGQLPKFSFHSRPVHHDEFVFFICSFIALGIHTHNFGLVAFLCAHAKQRERRIAGALKIVVMIFRQHDPFALVENRRLM